MYWITRVWPFSKLTSQIVFHGPRLEKKIAFTFDDGPSSWTIPIARLLEKHNGKGTFYVQGNRVQHYTKELRYLRAHHHEIGNHSYTHPALAFSSTAEIDFQIRTTQDMLAGLQIKTNTIRPPHGSFGINLYRYARRTAKKLILWDVDPEDLDSQQTTDSVTQYVLKHTQSGSIIDLHEYEYDTKKGDKIMASLRALLPILQKRGYSFVTISELLNLS